MEMAFIISERNEGCNLLELYSSGLQTALVSKASPTRRLHVSAFVSTALHDTSEKRGELTEQRCSHIIHCRTQESTFEARVNPQSFLMLIGARSWRVVVALTSERRHEDHKPTFLLFAGPYSVIYNQYNE